MSVLLETTVGDIVLDLDVEKAPITCTNFLKLCKLQKYTYCAFHNVQKNFLAQTGDPTSTGQGGSSYLHLLPKTSPAYSPEPYFKPERTPSLRHGARGTVSMALSRAREGGPDDLVAGSQFFITLSDNLDYLDGKHAPFAVVVEGQEEGQALDKINASFTDEEHRPLRDIRIKHVIVLEDPFPDPEGLIAPSRTPSPTPEQLASIRLGEADEIEDQRTEEEKEEAKRKADSSAAALTLEMVGDLPFADVRPPENILFVCKLNPVTRSEDLELIFSRFGKILSCEVIRDKTTGDSLQYAFIEFDERSSAEQAYFKMDAVLIDNQRIRVDFSQSVSKLHGRWLESRGVKGASRGSGGSSRGQGPQRSTSDRGQRGYQDDRMLFDLPSTSASGPQPSSSRYSSRAERPSQRDHSPHRDRSRYQDRGDPSYSRRYHDSERAPVRERQRSPRGRYDDRPRERDVHRDRDRDRDRDRGRDHGAERDRYLTQRYDRHRDGRVEDDCRHRTYREDERRRDPSPHRR
ncbi:unnamed protein product [Jaminaea pallidilutea]